jgi:hypothetical protein
MLIGVGVRDQEVAGCRIVGRASRLIYECEFGSEFVRTPVHNFRERFHAAGIIPSQTSCHIMGLHEQRSEQTIRCYVSPGLMFNFTGSASVSTCWTVTG